MGFTIAEMVVTLVVLSLFMTLFFQLFLTGTSQQKSITSQASLNDIALSNLGKVSSRNLIPASTTACQSGGGSVNNQLDNSLAGGSIIATNATSGVTTPTWSTAGLAAEPLTGTNLPNTGVVQELRVFYPQGCGSNLPAKIVSTVTYSSESVSHAAFVK